MTKEQLEKEFKRGEECVDHLLKFWKEHKFTRERMFLAHLEATKLTPNGPTMSAICATIMAERVMKLEDELAAADTCTDAVQANRDQLLGMLYRMARHVRNTDATPPLKWAVEGCNLLGELQTMDPQRYEREVKLDKGMK